MTMTAEQHKIRAQGIGASEMAAICGFNPWRSPLDVFLEKTGRAEPFDGNARTRLGVLLEPHILDWHGQQRGATDPRPGVLTWHPEHDWLFATPDRIATVDGADMLVEAKYVGFRVRDQWRDNTTPEYVIAQAQMQMACTGIQRCEVAAWIDGDYEPERIVPTPWQPELTAELIEVGREFWQDYVKKDVAPPIDASDAWRKYLQELYPKDTREMMAAPAEADVLVEKYLKWQKAEKHAGVQKDEAQHELQQIIGDAAGIHRMREWQVTWRSDRFGRVQYKAVLEALVDQLGIAHDVVDALVAQHTSAPGRSFYVKEF